MQKKAIPHIKQHKKTNKITHSLGTSGLGRGEGSGLGDITVEDDTPPILIFSFTPMGEDSLDSRDSCFKIEIFYAENKGMILTAMCDAFFHQT